MIKPKRLKQGDRVAVVSLSWGGLGDPDLIHKFHIAKERLEKDFGLEVICMPHALKGSEFVANHPELRARDLMEAFADDSIDAVFCAIGGDDTIRTLPYIDFEVIRSHPKIFMGYSDTTINHLMMYQAGVVSFYGPSVMCEFGEYVNMFDYTKNAVRDILFSEWERYHLLSSPEWSADYIPWQQDNINTPHTMQADTHGYEVLNGGDRVVQGHLLGGCIDVFLMAIGTEIWPSLDDWKGAILFIKGIMVGKPQGETYYEEYKAAIIQVVVQEEGLDSLPIFYNVNFGHAKPIGIIPYGIQAELDCKNKTITFLECPTV